MDDDDDYEIQRQKQIKENRLLLESLGLNSETVRIRSPSPPRPPPKAQPKKPQSTPSSSSSSLDSQSRQRSARLAASRPTRAYNEKELARAGYENASKNKSSDAPKRTRPAVVGTRKSRRLSGRSSGSRGQYAESDTSTSGEESDDRKPVQLKRLKNPPPPPVALRGDTSVLPPDGDSDEDWDKEDAETSGDGGGRDERGEYDAEGVYKHKMPLPTRETLPDGMQGRGVLLFEHEWSHFRPNLTPEEVLRGGAFGGTFFRPHYSTILRRDLSPTDDIAEMPAEWLQDLDQDSLLTSEDYDPEINRFGRKAGQSLSDWEKAGWIVRADPRGWFQWYLRFYLGRRSLDDARQVSRWQRACGPAGRFKRTVATQVARNGGQWDDEEVAPVIRQVCWQWAYELSERDYKEYLPDGG